MNMRDPKKKMILMIPLMINLLIMNHPKVFKLPKMINYLKNNQLPKKRIYRRKLLKKIKPPKVSILIKRSNK